MILEENNGVKLTLDRYLDGTHVFTVSGPGVERLKWYGYQNEYKAYRYFKKCVNKKRGPGV